MANTLTEFISHIKKNRIARNNRYRINFVVPNALSGAVKPEEQAPTGIDVLDQANALFKQADEMLGNFPTLTAALDIDVAYAQKVISLTCLMVDIPGYQEQATPSTNGNLPRMIVNGKTQNSVNTSFLLTGNYMEKKIFDAWHSIIMNESNNSFHFYDNYIAQISVDCLDEADQVVYSFVLTEAYPTGVSSLRLDRTGQNQQMVMDVSWNYHKLVNPLLNPDETTVTNTEIPTGAISGSDLGKKRLFPIPGLDSLSSGVQSAMNTVAGFRSQVKGVLDVAKDVREQVRDFKMQTVDAVKVMNGLVKDIKAVTNIPNEVKNEVVSVLVDTRNQLGYLKDDLKNIRNFPPR